MEKIKQIVLLLRVPPPYKEMREILDRRVE